DTSYSSGWKQKRLHRLQFMSYESEDTFGFLDPDDVVRATHLLPAFHYGRTQEYLPRSIARREAEENDDWKFYYVGFFSDRDLLMRYHDDAVGHR
ncbi:hypothetical protein GGX14DRAFT_313037, partial [Mycena pura]